MLGIDYGMYAWRCSASAHADVEILLLVVVRIVG